MFEFETSMSRPSAHELHMRARREQAQVVNAFLYDAARKLVRWLGILARNAMMLARELATEWRLRRDIRILHQLHDRELTDIGLGRGDRARCSSREKSTGNTLPAARGPRGRQARRIADRCDDRASLGPPGSPNRRTTRPGTPYWVPSCTIDQHFAVF